MERKDHSTFGNEEKLANWISTIRGRWQQDISEFEVPAGKLQHLAIICDGNRHFADENGLPTEFGHKLGLEVIKEMARVSREWGIKYLTFWVWSSENWKREPSQVDYIMSLARDNLSNSEVAKELIRNQVKFSHFGRKDRIPKVVRKGLEDLENLTLKYDKYHLNIALDYGGLDEVAIAISRIILDFQKGKLKAERFIETPDLLFNYLYTANQPFPDLIIRTGMKKGELPRTSGFLPLQTGYSCWSYVEKYFPDLSPEDFLRSVDEFLSYERRFGK